METNRTCPQCQQPLSADAPDGLCPQCLVRAVADPPASATWDLPPCDIIDTGDPAAVGKKLPQFEILEMLGRGGMGVVYKARQLQLDRIVALKILPPVDALSVDFVARFTREARALAKLNHPNIVNVHDFGETGGLYYFVMEYVDGANLRQLLETRKLTPAEALAIVSKICDALQYSHEEGLVHRDIKPENLLIDKKGRVKIADFGLAKLLRREALDMTLTLSGMTVGTVRYMAPEQIEKPETVDHRADLYSLGVVIYEMLTGETPVGRFELPSQRAQIDARLDQIVIHALEREPDRRYQHASEVRDDVEKVTSKPFAAAEPSGVVSREQPFHPPAFPWRGAFAILLGGWIVSAFLLNGGITGLALAAVLMGGIVREISFRLALRDPRWAEKWRGASGWKRFGVTSHVVAMATYLLILIGGTIYVWNGALESNLASPWAFEAANKGSEYKLIRRLDAFKDQAPGVELAMRDSAVVSGPFGSMPNREVDFAVGGGLIVMASLALVYGIQQSMSVESFLFWPSMLGACRGRWRPSLGCAGAILGSAVLVNLGLAAAALLSLVHPGSSWRSPERSAFVRASGKQAATAVRQWADHNGYSIPGYTLWDLNTVPKGEKIASVEVINGWKNPLTARWRMTLAGPRHSSLHLVVQINASEKPAQAEVAASSGYWVESGSEEEKQYTAMYESLFATVGKAAEIDLAGPAPTASAFVVTGAFPWAGVGGVLIATFGWILARAVYAPGRAVDSPKGGKLDAAAEPTPETSPESEPVRRARASWLGRRSGRFRRVVFWGLTLSFLVCWALPIQPSPPDPKAKGFVEALGRPSPWLVLTSSWHKEHFKKSGTGGHFSLDGAKFHPFTLSFSWFIIGLLPLGLTGYCGRVNGLLRYGRTWREIHPAIRRRFHQQVAGLFAVCIFGPVFFEGVAMTFSERIHPVTDSEVCNYHPKSKAYEKLSFEVQIASEVHGGLPGGRMRYCRPAQWLLKLNLETRQKEGTPGHAWSMEIEMPSLKADYPVGPIGHEGSRAVVLDLDELSLWMRDPCGLEMKDEQAKKEAAGIMAMIKRLAQQPPATLSEILYAGEGVMSAFDQGSSIGHSEFETLDDHSLEIYFTAVVVLLIVYIVRILQNSKAAFELDGEVRVRGEAVLAAGRLPRMSFGALPGDIRRRAVWRAAIVAAMLAAVPAMLGMREYSEPAHLLETRRYTVTPDSAAFKALTFTAAFESFKRGDDTWLVQQRLMPLEVAFTLTNGEQRVFTVDLPGLRATLPTAGGGAAHPVTLDSEELTAWMRANLSPAPDDATLQRDAGELMGFLKIFGRGGPATPETFANWAGSMLKHFHHEGFVTTGIAYRRVLPGRTVAVAIAVIALLLPALILLKRAAIRETMRREALAGHGNAGAVRSS